MYCKTHACNTLLVHSGAFAKYVGRLDLVVHVGEDNADPEKRSRIVVVHLQEHPGRQRRSRTTRTIANLLWPYSVKLNQDINLNGVFAYVAPAGHARRSLRNDTTGGDSQLGNLVARSMQLQQGVEAQFAFTNSLGIRADFERGPAHRRADVQRVPVREHDHRDVPVGPGGPGHARLRRPQERSARLPHAGAGRRHLRSTWCATATATDRSATGQQATACAKNISIGDNCRNGNPDGDRSTSTKCAAAVADRPLPRRGQRLHRRRRLGLHRAQAQHVAAEHRHLAARRAHRVISRSRPPTCDGMATDQIMDDTRPDEDGARTSTATCRAWTRRSKPTTGGSGRCSNEANILFSSSLAGVRRPQARRSPGTQSLAGRRSSSPADPGTHGQPARRYRAHGHVQPPGARPGRQPRRELHARRPGLRPVPRHADAVPRRDAARDRARRRAASR